MGGVALAVDVSLAELAPRPRLSFPLRSTTMRLPPLLACSGVLACAAGCGPSGSSPTTKKDAGSTSRRDAEPAELDATQGVDARHDARRDAGSSMQDGAVDSPSGSGSGSAPIGAGACYENIGSGALFNCLLEASNAPQFQCPEGFARVDGGTLDAAANQCRGFCPLFWGTPFCCITSTSAGGFTTTMANCYSSNDDGGSPLDAALCTGSLSTTIIPAYVQTEFCE
jgi:hypothetical protein